MEILNSWDINLVGKDLVRTLNKIAKLIKKKMKNYCCNKLQYLNHVENSMGFNFRIVKYTGAFKEKMLLLNKKSSDKGFVITAGYKHSIHDDGAIRLIINHCPFCGKNLHDYYKSEEYVQEIIE